MAELTAERVREVLNYDPETGVFRWKVRTSTCVRIGSTAGTLWSNGYRQYRLIRIDGRQHLEHRLAWLYVYGRWPDHEVDHVNNNGLDNSLANLREATTRQNQCNKGKMKTNTSGFKGVSWSRHARRWRVSIRANGKSKNLGYFHDLAEAGAAYAVAAEKYHGEFARTD